MNKLWLHLLCALTGLKYLSIAMLKLGSALAISLSISSIISFVAPYGFVVLNGKSSVIGHVCGSPYTVAD